MFNNLLSLTCLDSFFLEMSAGPEYLFSWYTNYVKMGHCL